MPDQTRLGRAVALAAEIHKDQFDKAEAPYILHAIEVMRAVSHISEDAMIVGVLHDTIEDSAHDRPRVEHQIREFGWPIFDSVWALTHKTNEPYDIYIERVAEDYLATQVKIADLTHNMDPRRIPVTQIVDKDFARWDKYRRALIRLQRGA